MAAPNDPRAEEAMKRAMQDVKHFAEPLPARRRSSSRRLTAQVKTRSATALANEAQITLANGKGALRCTGDDGGGGEGGAGRGNCGGAGGPHARTAWVGAVHVDG